MPSFCIYSSSYRCFFSHPLPDSVIHCAKSEVILIVDSTPESINIKKSLSFPFSQKNAFLGQTTTY